MLNWFKKEKPLTRKPVTQDKSADRHPIAAVTAPIQSHSHTGPNYNPDLIAGYLADHRHILDLFSKVKDAAEQKQWETVSTRLMEFQGAFNEHRANESVRLYMYLLGEDADDVEQMKQFSKEMHDIGKTVALFLHDQHDIAQSLVKQSTFPASWMGIGHVLGKRVSSEEKTLYPMYQESHGQ